MTEESERILELKKENAELRQQLAESRETLEAIQSGEVDALVVHGESGEQVYTLKDAEHPYRVMVESMNEGAVTIAQDGTIFYCNSQLASLLKEPLNKIMGASLLDFIAAEHIPTFQSILQRAFADTGRGEIELKKRGGGAIPVLMSGRSFSGDGGRMFSLVVTDLSEHKHTEEIMASEKFARMLLDQAADAIIICDTRGTILQASTRAHNLIGVDLEGWRFDQIIKIFYPVQAGGTPLQNSDRRTLSFSDLNQGKVLSGSELELIKNEHEKQNFILNFSALSAEDVDLGYSISLIDISERKRAEEALKRSEERFHFALENSHTGAWDLDLVDHSAFRTLEHDRIFGYSELLPQWTYEMFLEHVLIEDRVMVDAKFRRAMETLGVWNVECRIRRKDGEIRWIWAIGRHQMVDGKPSRMSGIVQDISERKQAEEVLQQYSRELENHRNHLEELVKQRTEELQNLSHRLIMVQEEERRNYSRELHDQIGGALTVLNLQLARTLRAPEMQRSEVQEVQKGVKEILTQVRTLSSSLHPGMLEDLGLEATLAWYVNDFSKKTGIEVKFEHSGMETKLAADMDINIYRMIQEALTNIARYAEVKEAIVSIKLENRMVKLVVADAGVGFDTAVQSQGVGLRGMRERVLALKGDIDIKSAPGQGTRIEINLPLVEAAKNRAEKAAPD